MLNGLKKVTSAVVALLIAFTLTGAFSRFDEIQVNADTTTTTATAANMYTLSGKASMQSYGNKKGSFSSGILTLGKKGKKKNIYAITINLKNNTGYSGNIRYRVYRRKKGWSGWKTSGQKAGGGKTYRVEAFSIELTGELAKHYSVYYRPYMQTYKYNQGWVSNGTIAGATGEGKRLEQIEVKLVARDQEKETPSVSYRMYRDNYKWSSKWSKDGQVAGVTSGGKQKHEGLSMSVLGSKYTGNIYYCARGQGYSWTAWNTKSAKVGKYKKTNGKRMEEVMIKLSGELAEHFDIYYRTMVKEKGWLGWAKNGERSGTDKYNYYIMALQCVIVPKDSGEPGNVGGIKSKYTSSYLVNGNPVLKFADFKTDYKTSKTMLGIDVSKYQGDINFKKVKSAGCEFVILRCYVRNNYYDESAKKYVWCNAPDRKFEQYYKDARAAGLKVGVYFFTCDYTEANMRKYTQDMINKCLKGKKLDFPIAFDWENFDYYKRAHKSKGWSTSTMNKHIDEDLNKMVAVFAEEVEKAGYTASIYGSKSRLEGTWSPSIKAMKAGKNNLSIWMAHWVTKSSYKGTYYMWQVNSHGRVPGISGDVDLDVAYIDRLPSPTMPVKPDDPGEGGETKPTDTPDTNTPDTTTPDNNTPAEGGNDAATPSEGTPEEGAQQPEGQPDEGGEKQPEEGSDPAPADTDKTPEEGNATPDEGSTAPGKDAASGEDERPSSDGQKDNNDETIDSKAKSVDNSSADSDKEEAPAKESAGKEAAVPAKEAEPAKEQTSSKDSAVVKETAPGKQAAPSKEQPAEVTTEGPE